MTALPELCERFDLGSSALIEDPYPVLRELREAAPIFWYERSGQWMVTRFAEVHRCLRDRRLGRAFTPRYTHEEFGREPPDPRWTSFFESERHSLLNLEPPDHTRLRALITRAFTPGAIRELRPRLEATADGLLGECVERGAFELLGDYAKPYSVSVICSLLGVPESDSPLLLSWSHAIVKMYELTTTDAQRSSADAAAREFVDYTRRLVAHKRARPDGRLLSELCRVEEQGERLTEDEIVSTTILLLNAGHEATVNVHGNGMRAFLRHPGEWRRLVSGEVAPRAAIEEMMRWDPPLQLFERWVLDPGGVEIAGQHVPFGQEIAMLFGSANRDPARFPEADRFDAGRGDSNHIGFGGGTHFCIGAPLARLELEVSLERFIQRIPGVRLEAEPRYAPTFVIRGLESLKVRV